jgi:hypothetical protein
MDTWQFFLINLLHFFLESLVTFFGFCFVADVGFWSATNVERAILLLQSAIQIGEIVSMLPMQWRFEDIFEDLGGSTIVPTTSLNLVVATIEASISNIFTSSVIVATPDCDAPQALTIALLDIELYKSKTLEIASNIA